MTSPSHSVRRTRAAFKSCIDASRHVSDSPGSCCLLLSTWCTRMTTITGTPVEVERMQGMPRQLHLSDVPHMHSTTHGGNAQRPVHEEPPHSLHASTPRLPFDTLTIHLQGCFSAPRQGAGSYSRGAIACNYMCSQPHLERQLLALQGAATADDEGRQRPCGVRLSLRHAKQRSEQSAAQHRSHHCRECARSQQARQAYEPLMSASERQLRSDRARHRAFAALTWLDLLLLLPPGIRCATPRRAGWEARPRGGSAAWNERQPGSTASSSCSCLQLR